LAKEQKKYPLRTALFVLIIITFMIMEFPGVFFFNRIDPMLFGLPFIYGFNIIMWAVMCVLFLIGYLTSWGKGADFKEE
jgi:hypothetical protein